MTASALSSLAMERAKRRGIAIGSDGDRDARAALNLITRRRAAIYAEFRLVIESFERRDRVRAESLRKKLGELDAAYKALHLEIIAVRFGDEAARVVAESMETGR